MPELSHLVSTIHPENHSNLHIYRSLGFVELDKAPLTHCGGPRVLLARRLHAD